MTTGDPSIRADRRSAFSLVEMIAIMAVVAMLSVLLIPMLVRQIDQLARNRETEALRQIASGLERHIVRNFGIPDHTTWISNVAAASGLSTDAVTRNDRGQSRVYLIDPTFRVGTLSSSTPPYAQTSLGSLQPVNPRVLVLSSLGTPLPAGIVSGFASSASVFQELWDTADGARPQTWTTWNGNADDIRILRINLLPLFQQITLNDLSLTPGRYGIGANDSIVLPAKPWSMWVLNGSQLHLRGYDGTVQSVEVVDRPLSFAYEVGIWRSRLFLGQSSRRLSGPDLQAALDLFLSSPPNANAKDGATQIGAYNATVRYITNYFAWADAGFPTSSGGTRGNLLNAQADWATVTVNLIFKP